jgi:predicted methyltransferase
MVPSRAPLLSALLAVSAGLAACAGSAPAPTMPASTPAVASRIDVNQRTLAIVAAPDRSAEDRALDAGRRPAELLAFLDLRPGMRVAELAAGGGYTTELVARAVGPEGRVWAQNNRFILDRFAAAPLAQRLAKPGLTNVRRADREFEDPLPADASDLDAVVIVLFYHDLVWFGVDRAAMNRQICAHLRPGGTYAIVDHSARPGAGLADVKTLHRIEEALVRDEIESAGFHLVATADFLRNPEDSRDWNASPFNAGERRGTSDRFALLFTKPVAARCIPDGS